MTDADRSEVVRLREANQLLSRFAGQAAHDLQEPLRLVSGYLDLICARFEGKADVDAPRLARDAKEAADRMQLLVAGLLDYTRVTNQHPPPQSVPLAKALTDATSNLRLRLRETGAQVTHGPLPTIQGSRTQLARVFQNLIENSLRYHARRAPVVHVMSEERDGEWIILVDDNGPGWPELGREQLFRPFAHLNTDSPGTGLGLAIVRGILEQHGGRALAADAPGGGARIELHFPRPT